MTSAPSPGCPDDATLRQIGHDEHPSGRGRPSGEDATIDSIWNHIEACHACQMRLEQFAVSERVAIAELIGHRHESVHPAADSQCIGEMSLPTLAGFRIIRQLGQGPRSRVFLAEELSTLRQIALKMIPVESDDSAAQRELWLSEVRAAASIEHANVVRLYRVEETHDCFLLAFEFVSGGTLRNWLSKPISQIQIARFVSIVAGAVHQIHHRGILHLDLKPSNILMDAAGDGAWEGVSPKIADFGISGPLRTQQSPRMSAVTVQGTPGYMAPEQMLGDPALLSPATDVYGLGGIFYCMLTGHAPIPDADSGTSMEHVLQVRIPSPIDLDQAIDPGLSEIAMRCLQRNPIERYESAWLLAKELDAWLERHDRSTATSSAIFGRRVLIGGLTVLVAWSLMIVAMRPRIMGHPENISTRSSVDQPAVRSLTSAVSVPEAVATLLAEQTGSAVSVDEQPLIRRLAELPPAFSIERAAQLVVDNRRFTDQILSEQSIASERCLQFATLQHASGIRFQEGGLSELYSTTRYLLQDSVRLLEFARQQQPNDQQILEKLIASKCALGMVRVDKGPNTAKIVSDHARESLSALRLAVPLVTQLKDQRQRVYWSGYLLDSFRLEAWNHRFAGNTAASTVFREWGHEAWDAFSSDQTTSDLAIRHVLFDPSVERLQNVDELDRWVLLDNRSLLHREYLYLRLADVFFSQESQTDGSGSVTAMDDWSAIVQDLNEDLRTLDVKSLTVAMIIHEDLIRPLTKLCTQYRSESQLDRAESLQQRYLNLCQNAMALYPDDSDMHLALSEAYLQAWKNALRRERPEIAVENLERSLASAQAAVDASPRSPRARDQVADRMKRLTRFQASRRSVSLHR